MAWGDFWEQGNNYNAPLNQDWYDTPLSVEGEQSQPRGTFYRFLVNTGNQGYTNKDQFAQSLYGKFYDQGYAAAHASNPFLTFRDYLAGFGPDFIQNQWNQLSPEQQGRDFSRFSPAVRIQRRG